MKLGMLSAAAAVSLLGVTGASAQVYVTDPYVAPIYAYEAPAPVMVPAPVLAPPPIIARAPVVVSEPAYVAVAPVRGYVPPKYSYTINRPRYSTAYATYGLSRACFVDVDGFRVCD